MFKLDHLEISGFKSFVDPVSIKFTSSLNSIVGPNGCGKSNVADAVTWVLGERSAKSLRAERMEDVIFNGSRSRKPLGMAEVTLTLHADPSIEQAQEGQLIIGRRLFRSGESTYLINGKTARLKEIRDLLMGTGLGIRAYSVIEQGKIDAILSGKPQERRKLLEEAAGITKYKQRKRIAEIKLEEAVGNLSRIDDIVSEVERSLRSLKRQANAARRYGDRRAEYDDLHRKVLLKRWSTIQSRLSEIDSQLATTSASEAEIAARLHRAEADLAAQRGTVDEQAETFNQLREREADIVATIEGKQEFIKGSRQVLREIAERLESGEGLARHRQEEIERLRELEKSYQTIHDSTAFATQSAATALDRTEALMSDVEHVVAEAEESTGSLRGQLLASVADVNGHRSELHRLQVETEKGRYRRTHLSEELGLKKKALIAARQAAVQGATQVVQLGREADTNQAALDDLSLAAERLASTAASLDERLDRFGREEAATRQRHQMLAELSRAHSDKRGAIRQLLDDAGQGDAGFLGDQLQIPEGWEQTLDLYLAELAEAVVLPAGADVLEVGRAVNSGRGITRLLIPMESGAASVAIDDRAVISSLAEALGLSGRLANALPTAYLVEGAAAAVRLAREHPGIAFLSGDRLWAQSGIVHIQGDLAEPGALARDQEIERMRARLGEIEAESHATATERIEVRRQLETAAAERNEADELLADCRRRLAVAEARQEDLESSDRRLALECDTLDSEQSEIDREIERISSTVEETRQRLSDAEAHHSKLESDFDAAQQAIDAARSERESVRTSGVSERGQLELLRERLDSHEKGLERIVNEVGTHDTQLAQWSEERVGLERRQSELGEAIEVAETELQQALEGRSSSEQDRRAQEERLQSARGAQLALEETVTQERHSLESIREAVSEFRVSEAGVRQESEYLVQNYREHFDEAPPVEYETPEEPLDELEIDFERMKQLLHRMGPINELAAEEFSEQEERHSFLTTQRADVMTSIERLRQTIGEINETSSERFRKTFEEVNESLGETFKKLFAGGEAEMRLMDEDDVLESGIEIVARPPGKRLQNIMLLSGGEKALTALALLFALFQTKPSPFCILDEVDAPLDDVNTMRFVGLLKQMARDTQFVVITHNKLTMSAASALYGVTMEERGVSRIVSVELDEIHPEEQAASA